MKRIAFLDLNSLITCFGEVIRALNWFFFSVIFIYLECCVRVLNCKNPESVTTCQRRNHVCQIPPVKTWAAGFQKGRETKALSNYNRDLVLNFRALWTSSWCALSDKTLWIQPRSPGLQEEVCVSWCIWALACQVLHSCPWKEWSNGRAQQTQSPAALHSGAFLKVQTTFSCSRGKTAVALLDVE